MSDLVIGIDLGTTNSCVAVYKDGNVEIKENVKSHSRITPSFVFFMKKERKQIIGEYGKMMAAALPENGIYDIKRFVGRQYDDVHLQKILGHYIPFQVQNDNNKPVIVVETDYTTLRLTPEDIYVIILKELKANTEKKLGHVVDKAVITVPAYFNAPQREATLRAASSAGFTVMKLLNEPTAAALMYYFTTPTSDLENYALVYDLGGGTFDVAVLKRTSTNIEILATNGNTNLGGKDFDNLLLDHFRNELKKYDADLDRRDMRRLQQQCEDAKKSLTSAPEVTVVLIGYANKHPRIEIDLTRADFEKMCGNLFQETIDIVDTCLRSASVAKEAIDEVILSGGSCVIPKLQEMLSVYFDGKQLNHFLHPEECVAEGAALQAALLSSHQHQGIETIDMTDVVGISLGVDDFVNSMDFLIKRNTPIPAVKSTTHISVYDQQTSVSVRIYEGERSDVRKNRFLGKISIYNITPAPPGQAKIAIMLTIDHNGLLTAKASEILRNNEKELRLTYTRGTTSESQVKNTLMDLEMNKEEDERFRKFADLKKHLIKYCIKMKYNLQKQNIVTKYKALFMLCKKVHATAKKLDVGDENKIISLTEKIELAFRPLLDKYKFDLEL